MKKARKVAKPAAAAQPPAAVWLAPGKLKPWADNPRLSEGEPLRKVVESIRRFGFGAPIVARAADCEIIAGHTRWRAALQLKLQQVPVRLIDVSADDAHKLALADNRLGELAEWSAALGAQLEQLDAAEMALIGWTQADYERISAELLSAGKLDEAPRLDRPGAQTGERLTVCPNCGVSLK